jgi:hypothetical protein
VHVAAAGFQDEKQYTRWSVTAQSTWKKADGQHRRGLHVQELPVRCQNCAMGLDLDCHTADWVFVDAAAGDRLGGFVAARGHVVYLTEHGERLAAIVPAEFAEALEGMSEQDARELLEDLADAAAAREALAEPGESVPWEQVRAEAGL